MNNTIDTAKSTSSLDLQLEIANKDQLRTEHYENRNFINFSIGIFPFICDNIPTTIA